MKRIEVKPKASLSLQMHHHRAEHWVVVKGTALVEIDGKQQLVGENQSTYIPLKVNSAGVIPVIFATSILFFPALVATSLPQDNSVTAAIRNWIDVNLANSQGTTWFYIFFLGILIIFFTYFKTSTFNLFYQVSHSISSVVSKDFI